MKKFSTIWEELGYNVGLKEGEDKGVENGKDLGLKECQDIGIKKGKDIGLKEGEAIGIKSEQQIEMEKLRTSAVKMIKKGIFIEDIHEFTELSIDEIEGLKKKIENGEL